MTASSSPAEVDTLADILLELADADGGPREQRPAPDGFGGHIEEVVLLLAAAVARSVDATRRSA